METNSLCLNWIFFLFFFALAVLLLGRGKQKRNQNTHRAYHVSQAVLALLWDLIPRVESGWVDGGELGLEPRYLVAALMQRAVGVGVDGPHRDPSFLQRRRNPPGSSVRPQQAKIFLLPTPVPETGI